MARIRPPSRVKSNSHLVRDVSTIMLPGSTMRAAYAKSSAESLSRVISSCRCFEPVELFRAGIASLTKSELDRKTSLRSRSLAHESRSTRIALRSGCPCLPRRQATNMLILTRDHLTCKSHCTHTASQHRLYISTGYGTRPHTLKKFHIYTYIGFITLLTYRTVSLHCPPLIRRFIHNRERGYRVTLAKLCTRPT